MSLYFEIKGYPGLNFIFHKAESQSLVNIFFSKQSFLISFKVLGQNRHACGKLFSLRLRLFFCLSPVRLVNGPMETNTVRLLYWRLCECQKCLPFYFHYGFIFIGLVHGRSSVLYFVCFTLFLFFVFFCLEFVHFFCMIIILKIICLAKCCLDLVMPLPLVV